MKSKYPLNPEFSEIEDYGEPPRTRPEMEAENEEAARSARERRADGITVKEETVTLPGYEGYELSARVFSPVGADDEVLPCIVNFHGGAFYVPLQGFQVGFSMKLAEQLRCRVVTVEYRIALDYPFPYPVEDCYATLCWVAAHAAELKIDPKRIVVFGESAGAGLGAAICQMARDRRGPEICYQMLLYPVTDSTCSTESAQKYVECPMFSAPCNQFMWEVYLKNGDFGMPQYAAPVLAKDLSNLPDAYVETTEFDCLHDESLNYALKLREAGNHVILNETKGTFHGFDVLEDTEYAKAAMRNRIQILKQVLYGNENE